jgi:hypothetical protein
LLPSRLEEAAWLRIVNGRVEEIIDSDERVLLGH